VASLRRLLPVIVVAAIVLGVVAPSVPFKAAANDVPVAMPMLGVTRTGDVSTTNFVPVPVCEAIDVALPTDVITPVRLALVTTVAANEPVPLPVTPPVSVIVWSPVFVPLRFEPVTAPVAAIVLVAVTVVAATVEGLLAPSAVFVMPTAL